MIKKIQFERFGLASEILASLNAQYPHPLGREEVAIDMVCMPLNPSDLMMTAGIYGAAVPPLPYAMGREGVGRIVETGPGVSKFSIGDLVIAITASTWQRVIVRNINTLILVPEVIDLRQAAMLRSRSATAAIKQDSENCRLIMQATREHLSNPFVKKLVSITKNLNWC